MFNLSANEFARVIDKDGKLLNLDITAYLKLSNKDIPFIGKIERINPEIMNIGSGRKLFASINLGENKTLRPGDFVVLEIKEPSLKNITVLHCNSEYPTMLKDVNMNAIKKLNKKEIINPPIKPSKVLFGLILINFFLPNVLPII